jgi:hypothetical protein
VLGKQKLGGGDFIFLNDFWKLKSCGIGCRDNFQVSELFRLLCVLCVNPTGCLKLGLSPRESMKKYPEV